MSLVFLIKHSLFSQAPVFRPIPPLNPPPHPLILMAEVHLIEVGVVEDLVVASSLDHDHPRNFTQIYLLAPILAPCVNYVTRQAILFQPIIIGLTNPILFLLPLTRLITQLSAPLPFQIFGFSTLLLLTISHQILTIVHCNLMFIRDPTRFAMEMDPVCPFSMLALLISLQTLASSFSQIFFMSP